MGKYTVLGHPEVEKKLDDIMKTITREVVKHLNPTSIILGGAFGKGEGIVTIENGKLNFLSDCDLIVITRRIFNPLSFKRLASKLTRRTGLEVGISGITLSIYRLLSRLLSSSVASKLLKPSIGNYEKKYGATVIYGENFLEKLPDFKLEDIPLWEGTRLILNRMGKSLSYSLVDQAHITHLSENERREALFVAYKTVLACQDALLLSAREYDPSYRGRNSLFQKVFLNHFQELHKQLPEFLPLTLKATNYRLKPEAQEDALPQNLMGVWLTTTEICDKVFKYMVGKDMGITFDTYLEFQEKYLEHPHVRRKPLYQNLLSIAKMVQIYPRKALPLRMMTRIWVPWRHILFSTVPLLYFGLSKDGEVGKLEVIKAREQISLFKRLESPRRDMFEEWKYLSKQTFNLWYTLCY